jgi:hypothetical protein
MGGEGWVGEESGDGEDIYSGTTMVGATTLAARRCGVHFVVSHFTPSPT